MKNKRTILLLVVIGVILLGGVYFLSRNKKPDKLDLGKEEIDLESETEKYYYTEELVGEMIWSDNGWDKLIIIDGKVHWTDLFNLIEMKSKEKSQDIPQIKMKGYVLFKNKEIWNIEYDPEEKEVVAESFDYGGDKKESIILKDYQGSIIDDSYINIVDMKVSDGFIYILGRATGRPSLHVYGKDGELKEVNEMVNSFDVDSEGNYIFYTFGSDKYDSGLYMIDGTSGEEILKNTESDFSLVRFSEGEDYIYGFDGSLKSYSMEDGSLVEEAFDFGRDSTYLLDEYDLVDFFVSREGDIYYSLKDKHELVGGSRDMRTYYYMYRKTQGEKKPRETSLTITGPYENDFMKEAIKRYELKYPEEHIDYQYSYNSYEAYRENTMEYGSKLALDIIGGDIGDLVHTGGGGIEIYNILGTDAFMDLSDHLKADKNYENLNKNVLEGLRINKGIRGLPITHILDQYELNEDLLEDLDLDMDFENISWSQVLDLVKVLEEKALDRHLFTYETREKHQETHWGKFSEFILWANMPDLIDLETKKVDLKQDWFVDLLIKFKEVSSSDNFVKDSPYRLDDRLQGSLLSFTTNRGRYYGDDLDMFERYNEEKRSRMIPVFTGEVNPNRAGGSINIYSINNRSTRKEEAYKFLSFLLEEDIQFLASRERIGHPINKKGLELVIDQAIRMRKFSGPSIDKYNESTRRNVEKVDYLYNMGSLVFDISRPIGDYMEGKLSLDEALEKAEAKVIIRLNE